MAYSTSNIGRPIQGISQQPFKVRLKGQCTEQVNLKPDVVKGLVTRPSSYHYGEAPFKINASDFKHNYSKDSLNEEYIIVADGAGSVRVFSPNGVEHIVNSSIGSYLLTNDPIKDLSAKTISDTTFILNDKVVIESDPILSPEKSYDAIVFTRFVEYKERIILSIDGVELVNIMTEDGGDPDDKEYIGLDYVSNWIYTELSNVLPIGFTLGPLDRNTFSITKDDGTDWDLSIADDADGKNIVPIKGSVKNIADLPKYAPLGYKVKVAQNGASESKDLWLISEATDGDTVIWKESIAPSLAVGLSVETMPVQLVRESIAGGVATFSLEYGSWADRTVGNDKNNPQPSFVGNPISHISLFQNRLVVSSGEFLIFSRSGDFYNFYKETSQTLTDADPISVFSDTDDTANIRYTLPFDTDLVAFSARAQFTIEGNKVLSPSTAVLKQTTSFDTYLDVPPVISGENIFFPFEQGTHIGVREYYTDSVIDTKRARPVTDHVKDLIPTGLKWLLSDTSFNILMMVSSEEPHVIYVYDWLWVGADKVQSAWSKWEFTEGDSVEYAYVEGSDLMLIINHGGTTYIERVDLGNDKDEVLGYEICIDRKVLTTFTRSGNSWIAPNTLPEVLEDNLAGAKSTGCYPEDIGTDTYITLVGDDWVTEEDLGEGETASIWVGSRLRAKYVPTNPFPRDREGKARGDLDKLTVSSFIFNYDVSGEAYGTVETRVGRVTTQLSSPRYMGASNNLIGFSEQEAGFHRFSIRQRADRFTLTLTTSSIKPMQIRDMEYDGNYTPRGRNI